MTIFGKWLLLVEGITMLCSGLYSLYLWVLLVGFRRKKDLFNILMVPTIFLIVIYFFIESGLGTEILGVILLLLALFTAVA